MDEKINPDSASDQNLEEKVADILNENSVDVSPEDIEAFIVVITTLQLHSSVSSDFAKVQIVSMSENGAEWK